MTDASPLPYRCAIAFKEWAGVCQALAAGTQSIIFRKGGIAEGPHGFVPEHPAFWLYPTHVHEAQQGLRIAPAATPLTSPGFVALQALAVVSQVVFVNQRDVLSRLAEFHVWTEETVEKRFAYRAPGLWVLAVRTFVAPTPSNVAVTAGHAGCKSWVPLDVPLPIAGLAPVVDDVCARSQRERLLRALDVL